MLSVRGKQASLYVLSVLSYQVPVLGLQGKDALAFRTWPEVIANQALGCPEVWSTHFFLVRCCFKRELEHYRWASFSPQTVTSRE